MVTAWLLNNLEVRTPLIDWSRFHFCFNCDVVSQFFLGMETGTERKGRFNRSVWWFFFDAHLSGTSPHWMYSLSSTTLERLTLKLSNSGTPAIWFKYTISISSSFANVGLSSHSEYSNHDESPSNSEAKSSSEKEVKLTKSAKEIHIKELTDSNLHVFHYKHVQYIIWATSSEIWPCPKRGYGQISELVAQILYCTCL